MPEAIDGSGGTTRRRRRIPAADLVTQPLTTPETDGATAELFAAKGPSGIEGVPASYDDGNSWLLSGAGRHPAAVVVALVVGWTGVWLALWGALVGAVLGLFIALGVVTNPGIANALFHLGLSQGVSVLGVLSGIVLGAVGGFLVVLRFVFVNHPQAFSGSFGTGVVVAFVVTMVMAAYEREGLRLRGYRRLSRDEVRRVAPLVKQVADAFDLPALPRFAMADIVVPNAWTHMRTIVLTKGLLDALSDAELEAVLAHELHHWRKGDAVGLRIVWVAALPVALIYDVGMWLAGARPQVPTPDALGIQLPRGFLAIVGWLIAWPTWVITKFVITPIVGASQRRYEYEADAAAKEIGLGAPLSSALRTMGAFETGRTGWEAAMAATHPPVELRVEALQEQRPDDSEYQEDDLEGPTGAELRRIFLFWRKAKA